jgi:DNA-binding IclR family transcriptional regulator
MSSPQHLPFTPKLSKPASVAVLAKGMSILESLGDEGEATPARLAEVLREPRSSIYRLLATLRQLDYVEPGNRRGSYRLSLKMFTLGSGVVSRYDEREAAHPVMERLHNETGETIFLCVRRNLEAVCIDRIDGVRFALFELRLGGAQALHLGAAPRAILAFEGEKLWEEYLAQASPVGGTEAAPHDREAILTELRATRARGYSISDQDVTLGIAAVGAPIFDHAGRVCASLSISGLREPILGQGSRAIELATLGATEVSRALGWTGEIDEGPVASPRRHPRRA